MGNGKREIKDTIIPRTKRNVKKGTENCWVYGFGSEGEEKSLGGRQIRGEVTMFGGQAKKTGKSRGDLEK